MMTQSKEFIYQQLQKEKENQNIKVGKQTHISEIQQSPTDFILDKYPPQERKFLVINKENGEIFNINEDQKIDEITPKIFFDNNNQPKTHWKELWQLHLIRKQYTQINQKFIEAVQKGNIQLVNQFVKQKSTNQLNLNYKMLDNWTAIHYVSIQGYSDILSLLIQNGIDINAVSSMGRNALHYAMIKQNYDCAKLLLISKINKDQKDKDGNTALHLAAQGCKSQMIQLLLQYGASNNIQNNEKLLAKHFSNNQTIAQILGMNKPQYQVQFERISKRISGPKIKEISNSICLEDFQFYKLLGQGAFGQVYLVKKKDTGKYYALKVILKSKVPRDLKKYVITEKNTMTKINSKFVVKCFFSFQNQTRLFLALEFCPGGDLTKTLQRQGKISQQVAKLYAAQIIIGLEVLHKNLIIFRDMKPDNIILDQQGHVKLTDFGLSKIGVDSQEVTFSFLGTPAYLPPQILNKAGHNRMADWYSFGAVLYELIVGIPPYYAPTRNQLFENIQNASLKIPKYISEQAKDLIKSLLHRNPKKRLGCLNDSEDVKKHAFFKGINWEEVQEYKLIMPKIDKRPIPSVQIPISFYNQNQQKNKIQNWTYIGDS